MMRRRVGWQLSMLPAASSVDRGRVAAQVQYTRRHLAAAGTAVLLGLLTHRLSGGPLPPCAALAVAAALGSAAVGLAAACGHQHRGSWSALGVLGIGQVAIDATLSLGVPGHQAGFSAAQLLAHPVAVVVLASMVLGVDRVRADAAALLDRVLVRWWRAVAHDVGPGRAACRALAGAWPISRSVEYCRPLRGPPVPTAGRSRSSVPRHPACPPAVAPRWP